MQSVPRVFSPTYPLREGPNIAKASDLRKCAAEVVWRHIRRPPMGADRGANLLRSLKGCSPAAGLRRARPAWRVEGL
ncbi:hypothetical protein GCM10009867_25380 [Pedococcus aerophilus]|uniref:Uncharacterized protein n=1 Tax=Pedococcus aerophilus TaxID=436356 RepID=A0ABP6H7V5_9MICO